MILYTIAAHIVVERGSRTVVRQVPTFMVRADNTLDAERIGKEIVRSMPSTDFATVRCTASLRSALGEAGLAALQEVRPDYGNMVSPDEGY